MVRGIVKKRTEGEMGMEIEGKGGGERGRGSKEERGSGEERNEKSITKMRREGGDENICILNFKYYRN